MTADKEQAMFKKYFRFLKDEFKRWWYERTHIYLMSLNISLNHNYMRLKVFDNGIDAELNLPSFTCSKFNMGKFGWFKISKHKSFEWQLMYDGYLKTGIEFTWTIHKDHPGIEADLSFFGFTLALKIYDGRHWDYEQNDWAAYNEN